MDSMKLRNISYTIALSVLLPLLSFYGARTIISYVTLSKIDEGSIYFVVAAVVGIASILFGIFSSIDYLAAGAILGGTFCLIFGYSYHWANIPDVLKFLSILLAIGIIIGTGYRFSRRSK